MDSTKGSLLLALLVLVVYPSAVVCLSQAGEEGSANDDRTRQHHGLILNQDVLGSSAVSLSSSVSSSSSAAGVLREQHVGLHQDVRGSSSESSSSSSSLSSSSSSSSSSSAAAAVLATKALHDDPFVINRLEVIPVRNITTRLEHGVEISVSPSMLLRSGEWVTVTWKGVKEPSVYDWIAVYVPADADPSKVAPVKYKMACNHPDHVKYGSGSVQFRLLNMRDDYRFVLVRNWGTKPVVISRSNTVAFSNYDEPTQIHLALTGKQGEMRVTWTTRGKGRAPYVRWGMTAGEYTSSCPANTTTYTRTEMCGGPARSIGWVAPGYFHTAVMKGLTVGTNIFYSVGDDGYAHSNPKSFYVPPNVGPQSTVRMLAFGDLGQAEVDGSNDMAESMEPSLLTARRIIRDAYMEDESRRQYGLLVLHAGDISYARGYTCQWDVFFDEIEPIASRVPYMVSVGNHERDWPGSGSLFQVEDSGGECGISYGRRLPMPLPSLPPPLSPLIIHPSSPVQRSRKLLSSSPSHSPSSLFSFFGLKEKITDGLLDGEAEAASANSALKNAGLDTPWYSVDYGPIHFVVMSTEHDFKDGSAQFSFLEQDLASVNRRRTPWVIFSGHRPMYVDSTDDRPVQGDNPVAEQMKHGLEELLMTYRVDLAMWGHHHTYERTCAVYRNKCVPPNSDGSFNAPVHLVVGMAGAGTCDNVRPVTPEWIEYLNTEEHGYVRLMVNATHLGYEFIGNSRGEILDRGFITRRFLW